MADIHVLVGDGVQHWRLLFHFPVPDQVNEVTVNYREALANWLALQQDPDSTPRYSYMIEGAGAGQITALELGQIQAGELYEYAVSFPAESGAENNSELVAAIRAEYVRSEGEVLNRLKKQLRYFGWSGSAT